MRIFTAFRCQLLTGLVLMGAFAFPVFGQNLPPLPDEAKTRPSFTSATPDLEWTDLGDQNAALSVGRSNRQTMPDTYRLLELDFPGLASRLQDVPHEKSTKVQDSDFVITLPMPDGTHQRFRVVESPILGEDLQSQVSGYRSYLAQGMDDPGAVLRLDTGMLGFHAYGRTSAGVLWIEPYYTDKTSHYMSTWKHSFAQPGGGFDCGVEDDGFSWDTDGEKAIPSSGSTLTTYRTALTLTGEYVVFFGSAALAENQAAVTMNRVNSVYEIDTAIRFVITGFITYTDPATDPFPNGSTVNGSLLNQNQAVTDAAIGSINYDIGHILTQGGGGGLAGVAVVCTGSKARGGTGRPTPNGDPFDIDYVAHEIGHQMGGRHTFNGSTGSCGGNNRTASSAFEPGSGSTIMAYAGICGAENVQSNSDAYFHVRSLEQIISTRDANGCGAVTATGNTPPVADAGLDATIPRDTPFYLWGGATDPDVNFLSYCWEQYDLGNASPPTDPYGPLFRSYAPSSSVARYFPDWNQIFAGSTDQFEVLPTVDRSLTFRLSVRDNMPAGGGVDDDELELTVSGAPFMVTYPNGGETFGAGQSVEVTWDVGGSVEENVNIMMYYEGNFAFLASATANDGTETVSLPCGVTSPSCRVWIEPIMASQTGVHYFDISDASFTLNDGLPDYAPYVATGYGDRIVANSIESPALPTSLIGDTASSLYWSFANLGGFVGCDGFQASLWLDETTIWNFENPAGLTNGIFAYWGPGDLFVRGGRHTTWMMADPDNVQAETDETNNNYARQWVWSPAEMTGENLTVRPQPPERFAGQDHIPDGVSFFANTDGLKFPSAGTTWRVAAISSLNASDYDVYFFDPTSDPFTGFETPLVSSRYGSGTTDFVLANDQVLGGPGLDVGLERFDGDGDYVADFRSPALIDNLGVSRSDIPVAAHQVISVGAFEVSAGELGRNVVEISNVTTDQYVELLVFDPTLGFASRGFASGAVGVNGNGRAIVDLDMTNPGTWLYVVVRNAGEGVDPFTYDLRIRATPADLATTVLPGSHGPAVPAIGSPNNLGDPIPAPAMLEGDMTSTVLYYHIMNNGPVATGPYSFMGLLDGIEIGPVAGFDLPGNTPDIFNQAVGAFTVHGGRHTIGLFFDSFNEIDELYEDNNRYSEQWVWEPVQLNIGESMSRGPIPAYDGGWNDIPAGLPMEPNADGVRTPVFTAGVTNGFWGGFAVTAQPGSDVDLRVHEQSTGAANGFDTVLEMSTLPGNRTEFILFDKDGNLPDVAYDMGIVSPVNAGGHVAQATESIWIPASAATPFGQTVSGLGLSPGQILGLYEFATLDGTGAFPELAITVENVTGDADLVLSVFTRNDETGFFNPTETVEFGFSDMGGPGENESVDLTLNPDTYYAIAVTKRDGNEVGKDAQFNLVFSDPGVSAVGDTPQLRASLGNHPNPFNPSTSINFSLVTAGKATVRIYDTQGRLVRTLVDEHFPAGNHSRTWQGRDDQGRSVASGVYLARFNHPDGRETRSMVLVK